MVGATVGLGATVVAVGVMGVTDIAAGAARPLDARPVEVQAIMKERFDRLDFEPAHKLQIIAYANFINNHVRKCTDSTIPWINFVPWSKHAWLWSEFIAAPPDPPDPPDVPEVSLDEVHAAFAATLPALTVSDTARAQVDAAAATFADSVSDAINIASRAASALDATSKAQAFALNAASKAASAFDYNTSAATEAAAGACFYSRCVVPQRCTYLLYSTSLKMPICRIHNPIPYVSTPPSHALEKGIRGGDSSGVRSAPVTAPCSCVSATNRTRDQLVRIHLSPIYHQSWSPSHGAR
jgi:hypothetical protein